MLRKAALLLGVWVSSYLSVLGSSKPALLQTVRTSPSDLELGGEITGVPPGQSRYVSYKELLSEPLVTYSVSDDSNFSGKTQISGIPLTELMKLLGAAPGSNLVVAICYDGYRTNYPPSYLAAHKPVLVLKINGRTEPGWPKAPGGGSMGPYLISHPGFTPSFKVLSHTDEPQIPYGVTRIEFRKESTVFGAIAPRGNYPQNSPVMQGYAIARQNCFRCHNMGLEGGQMSGRSWQILSMWAATEPKYFARYVRNPQAIDPKNHMPGNPQYSDATIEAIRVYFATFTPGGK